MNNSHPLSDRVWLHSHDKLGPLTVETWYFDVSRDWNFGGRKGPVRESLTPRARYGVLLLLSIVI